MAITAVETQAGFIVTGTTAASDDVTDKRVKVNGLYWSAPTTAGQKLAIQNKKGDEIIELSCPADGVSVEASLYGQWLDGIYSDDMDSGVLYIFCA